MSLSVGRVRGAATQVESVWDGAREEKSKWRDESGGKATHNLKFNISLPLKISRL